MTFKQLLEANVKYVGDWELQHFRFDEKGSIHLGDLNELLRSTNEAGRKIDVFQWDGEQAFSWGVYDLASQTSIRSRRDYPTYLEAAYAALSRYYELATAGWVRFHV
jgi:hypothetical protein